MIHISVTIKSLRDSVAFGLEQLGVVPGVFEKGIMIYGYEKIKKFKEIIGFSNFKNDYKYQKFQETGKVPKSEEVEIFIRDKIKKI
jgi:hypothetical protein